MIENERRCTVSKVIEKPAVESHREIEAKTGAPVREHRPLERPIKKAPEPRRPFVRWMGWLLGAILIVGAAGGIWWAIDYFGEDLTTPPIAEIDPHESPEIMRALPPVIPRLGDIDPHESPEIMRVPGWTVIPGSAESFSMQTRALLEANDGIDDSFGHSVNGWSLQTRKLLEWNSGGIDPFSLQTRILLEANDGIGD
jgi:hypothetical protein